MKTIHIPESVQTYLALTLEEDRTGQELTADIWETVRAESRELLDWVDISREWAANRETTDNRREMLALYRIVEEVLAECDPECVECGDIVHESGQTCRECLGATR